MPRTSDPRDELLGAGRPRGSQPQPTAPRDSDNAVVRERAREVLRTGGRLDLRDERVHRELARLILAAD